MKIKVIAVSPYDRWAFIKKGEKIFLLRPHDASHLEEVSKTVVEKAVGVHGFEECDIGFDTMDAVVSFVKDQFVQLRKSLGIEVPPLEELRELLNYASDDVLLEYLKRAKKLIPEKIEAAELIAQDLLNLEKVKNSPEMREKATEILKRCEQQKTMRKR